MQWGCGRKVKEAGWKDLSLLEALPISDAKRLELWFRPNTHKRNAQLQLVIAYLFPVSKAPGDLSPDPS